MKKFLVSIAWSQTDHENVLVTAIDRKQAEEIVNERFPGIHHITGVRNIQHDLTWKIV